MQACSPQTAPLVWQRVRRAVVTLVLCLTVLNVLGTAVQAQAAPLADHTWVAWGPVDFKHDSGAPQLFSQNFTVHNPNTTYTLKLFNGGGTGQFLLVSSAIVTLNGVQIFGPSDFNQTVTTLGKPVTLSSTNTVATLMASAPGSGFTLEIIGVDNDPPTIVASVSPTPNADGWNNSDVTVHFTCDDATSGIASCPNDVIVSTESANQTISGTATDLAGNTASTSVTINLDKTAPTLQIVSPTAGASVTVSPIMVSGTVSDAISGVKGVTCNGDAAPVSGTTFTCQVGLKLGSNTITVQAIDKAGNSTTATAQITLLPASNLPPDPSTVAPPIDRSMATDFASATSFLYTGTNPIQTGVAAGTIQPLRVAVVRGKVLGRDGKPLGGVKIVVLGHPEFGQTLSRADGAFDLAVNGGGQLTVAYSTDGFLPAQRQIQAPWRDYAFLPDVVLIQQDAQVTAIDLTSTSPIQVARGSVSTDAAGTRQATLLFPAGTQATMVMPDGTTTPLTTLHVRATEYTVGPNGPQAMPADLPATSAYTYAVEFNADEATAAGAQHVTFNTPIVSYTENFLNFPVGGIVPVGSYDRSRGQWVAAPDGRVIKILSVSGGLATLDLDGLGQSASASDLALLGITDAERQQLASLYPAGQSLWRVRIPHFTDTWDYNWGWGPPLDATPPPTPQDPPNPDDPCLDTGSIIGCETQALGEVVHVAGTLFQLHYTSSRTRGRVDAYTLRFPVTGASYPASLSSITVTVSVAGREFVTNYPIPRANLVYTLLWDGKDAYGRLLNGEQPAVAFIGYNYGGVYYSSSQILVLEQAAEKFGHFGYYGTNPTVNRTLQQVTFWSPPILRLLGTWDDHAAGLGGWTLDIQHAYDPNGGSLYLGNGQQVTNRANVAATISTVAGNGVYGYSGDGGPATAAALTAPHSIAAGPDGALYIVVDGGRVRRVGRDGIITTVAGNGSGSGCPSNGSQATAAPMHPQAVAVGPDRALYIADVPCARIYRVGSDGLITTMAGNGVAGFSGDGALAVAAQLSNPGGIALGSDGSLYISDRGNSRVRRVGPDGIISTVAGNGSSWYTALPPPNVIGDGGPASNAMVGPAGLVVSPDGTLYIADAGTDRVRRVGPNGIISTIAGTSVGMVGSGDGGLAINANLGLSSDSGVTIGSDGSVYVTDTYQNRVRRIAPDGTITTVAGTGTQGFSGDGGPAAGAQFRSNYGITFGADGAIYVADTGNNRIRRISALFPEIQFSSYALPSPDGSEVYNFDQSGRHLKTLDALTGTLRYQFAHDTAGRLISVTDGDGNVTTVERDANGNPTAIVSPFGQRTALALDANGNLASVTDPLGGVTQLSSTADGLLSVFTDPQGNVHRFTYDALGRLVKDEDPAGGSKTLARTDTANGYSVSVTTALGRTTAHLIERTATGGVHRVTTDPSGLKADTVIGADGTQVTTYADGTRVSSVESGDPRWGMQAPLAASVTTTTGGHTQVTTTAEALNLTDPNNLLAIGTLTWTVTVNGQATTLTYDGASRTLTTTSPEGRKSVTTLDAHAHVQQVSVPTLADIHMAYDTQGRPISITSSSGTTSRTTTLAYASSGFLSSVTDPLNRTVTYATDMLGRVTTETLPDGQVIAFAYDKNSNLTSLTPPGRPAHQFAYSPIDQVTTYQPPAAGLTTSATSYQYNTDHQATQTALPTGEIVGASYDAGGRLTGITLPAGQYALTYDPTSGNVTHLAAPGNVGVDLGYDGALLTSEKWSGPITGSVAATRDDNFRTVAQSVNGANSVALSYDRDGALTHIGDLALTRDPNTALVTATALGTISDSISYSPFAEATAYQASNGTTALYQISYTRDAIGRITAKQETIGGASTTTTYGYDAQGRLVTVAAGGATTSYTYDGNGNRTSVTGPAGTVSATYDEQDRLLQYGATTYTYDANGALTSKVTSGQTTSYHYDPLGNLTAATLPNGTAITYVVDGQSRRIGKQVNGTLVQGFLYQDGLRPVAELDGAGNLVSRFVYAGGNVPAYMIKGGATYRLITDQVGSVRLVVNAATGQVAQQMDYDPFGVVTSDTNPGFQPFGFAGGLYDRDTGLVRFGARDYDAATGRWTAKDPLGFEGGQSNLYNYVGGNPITNIDPTGQFSPLVHFRVTFGAAIFAGMGIWDSLQLAWYSVWADWGTQGVPQAYKHSMTPDTGICPFPGAARSARDRYVDEQAHSGTLQGLGNAVHAMEDEFAGGHDFKPYSGFSGLTLSHVIDDWFPFYLNEFQASVAASAAIADWQRMNGHQALTAPGPDWTTF